MCPDILGLPVVGIWFSRDTLYVRWVPLPDFCRVLCWRPSCRPPPFCQLPPSCQLPPFWQLPPFCLVMWPTGAILVRRHFVFTMRIILTCLIVDNRRLSVSYSWIDVSCVYFLSLICISFFIKEFSDYLTLGILIFSSAFRLVRHGSGCPDCPSRLQT